LALVIANTVSRCAGDFAAVNGGEIPVKWRIFKRFQAMVLFG
jgi:hypothetical protein